VTPSARRVTSSFSFVDMTGSGLRGNGGTQRLISADRLKIRGRCEVSTIHYRANK
jgi:hypothetical protein